MPMMDDRLHKATLLEPYRFNKWPIKNDSKIRSITHAGVHHRSLLPPPNLELGPAVRALGCSAEIRLVSLRKPGRTTMPPTQRTGGAYYRIPFAEHLETAFLSRINDIDAAALKIFR